MLSSAFDVINLFKRETAFIALTRYGHIKTAEQRAVTQYNTVIGTLDADGWVQRGGWYSEEGTGRGRSPPRPFLAVPNVTAHPSTASTWCVLAFLPCSMWTV